MTDAKTTPDPLTTLLQARFDPSEVSDTDYVVTVVQGPDRGASVRVGSPERVLVGTGPTATLRLADRQVSRRHLALEIRGGDLWIEDLGSTNGTWLAGAKLAQASVSSETSLMVGESMLSIEPVEAEPPSLPNRQSFGRTVGASREMRALYPLLERLAASTVPVIIEGETGTGKEVLAESVHEESPRKEQPFIVFDCTAVPPSLVESELFGHERGAFTGAHAQRKGVFEQADGGTLLIDEIGDLDAAMQPKLLRALERSEVRRVGGDRWIRSDVRILCATRRNLEAEVEAGRFRDDLFHRLAVARVELPPLRRRRSDVGFLASMICQQLGGTTIDPQVLGRWERYSWPGNVRELRNAVARWLALGPEHGRLRERAMSEEAAEPADVFAAALAAPTFVEGRDRILAEFEKQYVAQLLTAHGGNVSKAAAAAGIARRYFQIIRARSSKG